MAKPRRKPVGQFTVAGIQRKLKATGHSANVGLARSIKKSVTTDLKERISKAPGKVGKKPGASKRK